MGDFAKRADLLPADALGALDAGELGALRSALLGDARLRAAAAGWQSEVEALALSVVPITPAATTRARLLRSISRDTAEKSARADNAVAKGRGSRAFAAVAAVLVGVVVWGAIDRGTLRREVERLRESNRGVDANLASLQTQLATAQREVIRLSTRSNIVAAPDMHPVVLAGLAAAPSSTARTFISPRDGKALFYAYSLPAAPAGKQYQLWFIAGGKPVSGGVFDVDEHGNGTLVVENVAPLEAIQAWAVTLEPAGGLPAPSGAMVLKG